MQKTDQLYMKCPEFVEKKLWFLCNCKGVAISIRNFLLVNMHTFGRHVNANPIFCLSKVIKVTREIEQKI